MPLYNKKSRRQNMALIKCPECGNLVSDTCDICIHCGFKLTKKTIEKVDLEDFEIVSETS